MDENLIPFKDYFYKECTTISFFINVLKEIEVQISFYGYICEKDFKIFTEKAEKSLKNIEILKSNIKKYKDEPSNLYLISRQLIKFLYIFSSSFKKMYPECLSSIKSNIKPIIQNIKNTRKNIINHSISMLKQTIKTKNLKNLSKYMAETLELIMINTFKSLFSLYQLILIYSKKKNNLYERVKTNFEPLINAEEINIIINEISERLFAEKYKINYEPLYFGNNDYKELLTDEKKDVMLLSKSFLNYTNVFIKCIQIRKKLFKELRIFLDVLLTKDKEQLETFQKVCGKITSVTKGLTYSSQGIINSWNLIFSSWNSVYINNANYLKLKEESFIPKLNKIINECSEEYKNFEKRWEKYSSKINELRKNVSQYSKFEKDEKKLEEKKNNEEALKNYLMIDCTDFLDNNVPLLRESEIKRANEIKDLADKIKSNINANIDEYLENSEKEYDNAASIDLFEEVQNIFESQFQVCGIQDSEKYFESLREKLENIDLNDKLSDNARLSLAEYYEHNDFDDEFEFSKEDMENPFGNAVKDNEDGIYNFEKNNLAKSAIGMVEEELISNISKNEKNTDFDNNATDNSNYKTPNFKFENKQNANNNGINRTSDENDYFADLKIINNLKASFKEQERRLSSKNINFKETIKIFPYEQNLETIKDNEKENETIDKEHLNNDNNLDKNSLNKTNSDKIKKQLSISFNNCNFVNPDEEKDSEIKDKELDIKNKNEEKIDKLNEVQKNKNKEINNQDKQTLHYGILGILGLFCLKSLFSSNNIISIDSFLNVVILGIISFILYKTQFQ